MTGQSIGAKAINLRQLQDELTALGVAVGSGLGTADQFVYTFDGNGAPADFAAASASTVDQAITTHVAMRDKTDVEYATEFQDAGTTPERKQEIRDITAGLLPREQVPM